jgi:hypothetical protein
MKVSIYYGHITSYLENLACFPVEYLNFFIEMVSYYINIFIDIARRDSFSVCPIINGLSDHDAQSITLNIITLKPPIKQVRKLGKLIYSK